MILSVSRRTDIPGHYAEWLMNRLREGYALTRNPMNHAQLYRVPLNPEIVDAMVFWSKDPAPMLPYLQELDDLGYCYLFQFTLTPYDRRYEPGLREKTDILRTFLELSRQIGRERVLWRYDPILLNEELTKEWHREQFTAYCERLAPYTTQVTISFVDLYPKLKTPLIRKIEPQEMTELAADFGSIAAQHELPIYTCCETPDFSAFGIRHAACIDRVQLEHLCGTTLSLPKDPGQRPGCGCAASVDIGVYDTCPNGCVYCYANHGTAAALHRNAQHNPASPLLFGTVLDGEIIIDRKVKSHRDEQLRLF